MPTTPSGTSRFPTFALLWHARSKLVGPLGWIGMGIVAGAVGGMAVALLSLRLGWSGMYYWSTDHTAALISATLWSTAIGLLFGIRASQRFRHECITLRHKALLALRWLAFSAGYALLMTPVPLARLLLGDSHSLQEAFTAPRDTTPALLAWYWRVSLLDVYAQVFPWVCAITALMLPFVHGTANDSLLKLWQQWLRKS